jgi:hypothetical protein
MISSIFENIISVISLIFIMSHQLLAFFKRFSLMEIKDQCFIIFFIKTLDLHSEKSFIQLININFTT